MTEDLIEFSKPLLYGMVLSYCLYWLTDCLIVWLSTS